jgi:lipid A ethanolaminephosphotransferase
LAPSYQTEVPFLIWMSRTYQQRTGASTAFLAAQAESAPSHDNLYHTVIGSLGVRSPVYQQSWGLFARCIPVQVAREAE